MAKFDSSQSSNGVQFSSDNARLKHQELLMLDRKNERYVVAGLIVVIVGVYLLLAFTKENLAAPMLTVIAGLAGYFAGQRSKKSD